MHKIVLVLLAVLAFSPSAPAQNCERENNCGLRKDWRIRISVTPPLYRLSPTAPTGFEQFRGERLSERFATFEWYVLSRYPLKDYGEPTVMPPDVAPPLGTDFTLYMRRAVKKYNAFDGVNAEIALERRAWRNLWVEGSLNAWTPAEISTETVREFLMVNAEEKATLGRGPTAIRVGRYRTTQTDEIRRASYALGLMAKYDLSPGRHTVIAPGVGGRLLVSTSDYRRIFETSLYDNLMPERYAASLPNGLADTRHRVDGADQVLDSNNSAFWQWVVGLDLSIGGSKTHNQKSSLGVSTWIRYAPFGGTTHTTAFDVASPMKEISRPPEYQAIAVSEDFSRWYGGFALTIGF